MSFWNLLPALAVIFGIGWTSVRWMGLDVSLPGRIGLMWMNGTMILPLLMILLGTVVRGSVLVATITLLAAIGLWLAHRRPLPAKSEHLSARWTWLTLSVSAAILVLLLVCSAGTPLWWDSAYIWHFKAHAAWLDGGVPPVSSFADPSLAGTHPSYPLALPEVNAWCFLWQDASYQIIPALLSPIWLICGMLSLFECARKLTRKASWSAMAVVLVGATPYVINQAAFQQKGYADLWLGFTYAIAIATWWMWRTLGETRWLFQLSLTHCGLVFQKQEGIVLLGILAGVAAIDALWKRRFHALLTFLPAVCIAAAWHLAYSAFGGIENKIYHPLSVARLIEKSDRVPMMAKWAADYAFDSYYFGATWWLMAISLLWLAVRKRIEALYFSGLILLPLLAYGVTYLFTTWEPWDRHFMTSFARLNIHVVPAGAIIMAMMLAGKSHRTEDLKPS